MRCELLVTALVALTGAGCQTDDPSVDTPGTLEEVRPFTSSRAVWDARREEVRESILRGAELWPLPARTPLAAESTGILVRGDGYVVEGIRFEPLPGFVVIGNLYRPTAPAPASGLYPAILRPHGHFHVFGFTARTRPELQTHSISLARKGAIVFAYDMVGWGESRQVTHAARNTLAIQLWSSIRAVDYLEERGDVDPTRIGVTGASGGASQAMLLLAVDDRVAAAALVSMISSGFQGGDTCEVGMPIRSRALTNNLEMAAMAAPRPLLVVSSGGDWTSAFVESGDAQYLEDLYALHGSDENLWLFHDAHGGHDYARRKQVAATSFFESVLGLEADAGELATERAAKDDFVAAHAARRTPARLLELLDPDQREEDVVPASALQVLHGAPLPRMDPDGIAEVISSLQTFSAP